MKALLTGTEVMLVASCTQVTPGNTYRVWRPCLGSWKLALFLVLSLLRAHSLHLRESTWKGGAEKFKIDIKIK